MTPEQEYLEWRTQPAVGCLFARAIAARPKTYGQAVERISAAGTAETVANRIESQVATLVAANDIVAAALVFPDLTDLAQVTRIMLALRAHEKWSVRTSHLENEVVGPMVAVHVARQIPFGTGECPSEGLVLGPFEEFPPTRRAPHTALELFVGVPRATNPKDDTPTEKAHLAHMEMNLLSHDAFLNMWKKSVDGRTESIGGPGAKDNRAKAKVTFVISPQMAADLGCAP